MNVFLPSGELNITDSTPPWPNIKLAGMNGRMDRWMDE